MSVEGPLPALQPGECDHRHVKPEVRTVGAIEDARCWRCQDCGALLPPGPPPVPRWRRTAEPGLPPTGAD